MRSPKLNATSPLIRAGFFSFSLKRLFKHFNKIVAAVLVMTFSASQFALAADVRQMLLLAKKSFEQEDQRRVGGSTQSEAQLTQSQVQQLVDEKNELEHLSEKQSYSLTTQNGDILNYVDGKLRRIDRPDGTSLKNILLDSQGNIQSADIKLNDGSVQVYSQGQVIGYRLPNGNQAVYENGVLTKIIAKSGQETTYTYVRNAQNAVTEIILESSAQKAWYAPEGRIIKSLDKAAQATTFYSSGIIQRIEKSDGSVLTFEVQDIGVDRKIFLAAQSDPLNPFQYAIYRPDNTLKEIRDKQGRRIQFDGQGVVVKVTDADGLETDLTFEQGSLSTIINSQIHRPEGVTSSYDADGQLKSIEVNGLKIFYKEMESGVDYIEASDGTELHNLVFDSQGAILDARMILSDGEERIYKNGKLDSLQKPDLTKVFYFDNKPIKLLTSEKVTYNFTYQPDKITASIDASSTAGALTAVSMEYDPNYNLKKLIRQNSEVLSFLNNDLTRIDYPSDAPQVFTYTRDAQGNVLSYKVTQGDVETFYDAQNQITRALVHHSSQNQNDLDASYQYGKIREIKKNGVLTFKYSYSFDSGNQELTSIEDLEEKNLKVYKDARLLTSYDQENSVLSSYAYADEKISQVNVTRFGRQLHTYIYTYSGSNTIVSDEQNVVRTYAADQRLLFLEKDGQKFSYAYKIGADGKEIAEEKLIERALSGGARAYYQNGQLDKIELSGGGQMRDLFLDDQRRLAKATLYEVDGSRIFFENGDVVKVLDPQNKEALYTYEKNTSGAPTVIWVNKEGVKYKYAADSSLLGVSIPEVVQEGGINFYDYSSSRHAMTPGGQAVISNQKFKEGSYALSLDGQGDYLKASDSSGDFDFGTGDFSVELWVNFTEIRSDNVLIDRDMGRNGFTLEYYAGNLYWTDGSSAKKWESWQAQTNTWYQVSVTRQSSQLRFFINGQELGQAASDTTNISCPAADLYVGSNINANMAVYGYIDGIKITKAGQVKFDTGFDNASQAFYEFKEKKNSQGAVTGYDLDGYAAVLSYDSTGSNLSVLYKSQMPSAVQAALTTFAPKPKLASMKSLGYSQYLSYSSTGSPYFNIAAGAVLGADMLMSQEYSSDGTLETQTKGDGSVTLFENNKPSKVLDKNGNILVEYTYDAEGNPSKIYLKNAREVLPKEVTRAQEKIQSDRLSQLLALAAQRNVATAAIQAQFADARNNLSTQLSQIQSQYNDVAGTQVSGKKAKSQKGDALNQIGGAMDQVRAALASLNDQESDAIAALDTQIKAVSDQIEANAASAFQTLGLQEKIMKDQILSQEISPIIYDYYRRILGRDPSNQEYADWISKIDYSTGKFITGYDVSTQTNPGASMKFDGTNDNLKVSNSSDLNFGTGDFTMEFFVRFSGFGTYNMPISRDHGGTNGGYEICFSNSTQKLSFAASNSVIKQESWSPTTNTWYHVAMVRSAGTLRFYVNGTELGSGTSNTTNISGNADLYVGSDVAGNWGISGWLDEVRLSNSARYAANFTPAVQRFSVDANTKLLLRPASATAGALIKDYSSSAKTITMQYDTRTDKDTYKLNEVITIYTPILKEVTTALRDYINALPELAQRTAYVNSIKSTVVSKINAYLAGTEAQKTAFLASLGLGSSEIIALSSTDASKILNWINTRSLHFGQSAFISLETLLNQKGISYAREDIAWKAIAIDILTGVITPMDDGDLVISVYALNKVAGLYNLTLSGANLTWDDLRGLIPATSTTTSTRIIAHVNGNHFVILTAMTADTVTYIDPGVGPDGQNQVVTISKKDFTQRFKGNVIIETSKLTPTQQQTKLLSLESQKKIRGAFLPLLFIFAFQAIAQITAAVWTVLSTIGAVLATVGSLVGSALSAIGQVLSFVGQTLSYIGTSIFQAVHFAASTLYNWASGFFASVANQSWFGGLGKFAFGDTAFKSLVKTGLNFAFQRGLEAMGVNSNLASAITSFASGNPLSFAQQGSKVVVTLASNAVQSLVKTAVNFAAQTLIQKISLDPNLANALTLVTSSFVDGIQSGDIGGTLVKIIPQVTTNLSTFGFNQLGSAWGLNPILTTFISSPFASFLNSGFSAGVDLGQSIINSVRQGMYDGIISYGMQFVGQQSPILGSLLSRDVMQNIAQSIGFTDLFNNAFDFVQRSALNVFNVVGGAVQSVFGGVSSFASAVQQRGLSGALDYFKAAIFGRESLESILSQGGMQSYLQNAPRQNVTLPNGQSAQEIAINGKSAVYINGTGDVIAVKDNGFLRYGTFGVDSKGNFGLIDGSSQGAFQNGLKYSSTTHDGQVISMDIKDASGSSLVQLTPDSGQQYLYIQGPTQGSSSFDFWGAALKIVPNALTLMFGSGVAYASDLKFIQQISSAYTNTNALMYSLVNGIANPNTSGTIPPSYINSLRDDLRDNWQVPFGDILPVPIYQKNFQHILFNQGLDAVKWALEAQTFTNFIDLTSRIGTIIGANLLGNRNRPIVGMGYSGGFIPLVEAIKDNHFNVQSLVALGAATWAASQDTLNVITRIIQSVMNLSIDGLQERLRFFGVSSPRIDQLIDAVQRRVVDEAFNRLVETFSEIIPSLINYSNLPSLSNTNVSQIVNVWGTKDILYNLGIAGKRVNLCGVSDITNIEIIGAEHGDYMRRGSDSANDDPEDVWNQSVAAFVSELIVNSENDDSLFNFLTLKSTLSSTNGNYKIAYHDLGRDVWVIRVPGWENHQ